MRDKNQNSHFYQELEDAVHLYLIEFGFFIHFTIEIFKLLRLSKDMDAFYFLEVNHSILILFSYDNILFYFRNKSSQYWFQKVSRVIETWSSHQRLLRQEDISYDKNIWSTDFLSALRWLTAESQIVWNIVEKSRRTVKTTPVWNLVNTVTRSNLEWQQHFSEDFEASCVVERERPEINLQLTPGNILMARITVLSG